jgi:hypothetical protein
MFVPDTSDVYFFTGEMSLALDGLQYASRGSVQTTNPPVPLKRTL